MPCPRRAPVVLPRLLATLVATLLATLVVAAPSQASPAVEQLQQRLNSLGCGAGPVDGHAGTWTHAALVRFQAANRLAQDGTAGPATRRVLDATRQVRCDRRPVVGSATGRRIVVSQRQNYVWLVGADGRVLAQGGMVDNRRELRAGTYRTGSKCGRAARIRDNSDASGRLRLHAFVRFAACGIGFHQVPQRRPGSTQIHSDRLLGTDYRESHGCIRVSRTMSNRIWAFATTGTTVVVLR
jgi:hypothetical protein